MKNFSDPGFNAPENMHPCATDLLSLSPRFIIHLTSQTNLLEKIASVSWSSSLTLPNDADSSAINSHLIVLVS